MADNDALGEGISTRILRQFPKAHLIPIDSDLGVDIEKLISLLAATGISRYSEIAEKMRQKYFEEIRDALSNAKITDNPQLATALLQMHADAQFLGNSETLSGIITTNHDGLLQIASQNVLGGLNVGFDFESDDFQPRYDLPQILQLHGSFTWRSPAPFEIEKLRKASTYSRDTVWIPPTILKESKSYPFNKLNGLAFELLSKRCDVLRVVGCSLTQNDWNILSLIFNAQRLREIVGLPAFQIQLIMSHGRGESIRKDCSYLRNVIPIGYLSEGSFEDYKTEESIPANHEMRNAFAYWLKEKVLFHRKKGQLSAAQSALPALARLTGDL